ncbi:Asd/ArgC dimerization domain-containing protein, partial [Streptomyces sp. ODS05-4]|uniref:Asd/ArgC dimerization domain-containing protein n=1 Tax=Streptomyces sp. ODS05-4 TaxID=2944939 RepID=UPI00210CE223
GLRRPPRSGAVTRRPPGPGCYPTAVTLALFPAFGAGLVELEAVVVAASGTSGAGRALKPHLLGAEVMGSMSPYGVGGGHRHTPEMAQNLSAAAGEGVTVSFTPLLAPMPRGILATCSARLRPGADEGAVREAYAKALAGEEFVRLLPAGRWPATAAVAGSNSAQVQWAVDPAAGRLTAVCAIDNLVKGTAGGAVQCMNLALGLSEGAGLTVNGVAP